MRFWRKGNRPKRAGTGQNDALSRRTNAIYQLLAEVYGRDKLVLKAGKLEALELMQGDLGEQVLALERIVFEDPTLEKKPEPHEIPKILDDIEESIADLLARRDVEDRLEQRVAEKMQERHEEYVNELKLQVLKEDGGPDNAQTLKKFAELQKLEERKLANSILKYMRPRSVDEVIGQETARKALFSKIASPFPQHVLLYGPPGVGKTTVARLALEYARKLPFTPFDEEARFVEVDGSTLRWDPREVTNPLLGSVHDPIYQGARRDLAESSIPEPKPGLVTEAHGGVLFIDEIGEMDPILQNKLLKVLEDKRVHFDSSYYDPSDANVPKYIRKLFEEGAPADFVLIGATTRDPEEINPALRSRCAEVFFDPLGKAEIEEIVRQAASRLGVALDEDVPRVISEYTIEGRKATGMLADAYGIALHRMYPPEASMENGASTEASIEKGLPTAAEIKVADGESMATAVAAERTVTEASAGETTVTEAPASANGSINGVERSTAAVDAGGSNPSPNGDSGSADRAGKIRPPAIRITRADITEVIRMARLTPSVVAKGSPSMEVGHLFGLGVSGFMGSVIEIEAVAFRAHEPGKGSLRFNQTAGSMAKDSVFNAASVVRKVTGERLSDWDVHVNIVGGGRIDGPSAGAAVVLAIISALQDRPVRQDIAITGEISIQGRIKPVGGVYEKLYGARQAGITCVLIPERNAAELPAQVAGVSAIPVQTIEEAMEIAFANDISRLTKAPRANLPKLFVPEQHYAYRKPISGSG